MAAYTTIDDPEVYMVPRIWDGTGSSQTISCGFQPDITWVKARNQAYSNRVADSVRGYTSTLITNSTAIENTSASTVMSGTTSDGFTVVSDSGSNESGDNYVGWSWKAGTTTGIAGSPDITPSSYSFNQTSGFSIIAYTGNGTAGDTIPHGLGVAPTFIMVKRLDAVGSWVCYHSKIDSASPEDYYILLESTAARVDSAGGWNDTAPSSTLITLGSDTNIDTATYIAYCFADVQGYSHAGSYVGNLKDGDDGPFSYTGFRPAFIMIKDIDGTPNWTIRDNNRDPFNPTYNYIYPNLNQQGTDIGPPATSGSYELDFLSNGFKIRNTDDKLNTSGNEYIYMAFADAPLVNSKGVPSTGR
jgi:hypothetical protein